MKNKGSHNKTKEKNTNKSTKNVRNKDENKKIKNDSEKNKIANKRKSQIDEKKESAESKKKEENKEVKKSKENDYKNSNRKIIQKIIIIIFAMIILAEAIYGGYLLYEKFRRKFKNVNVEIGTSEKVSLKDFLVNEKYLDNSQLLTNLDDIDYLKVGEYKVILSHDGREEEVSLNLVDTTPPEVKFKNIEKYIDYTINADDFIEEKNDLSEMQVEIIDTPEITEFKDYDIKVRVKDVYGNETSNICKLYVKWIKDEFAMEKGHELTREDLLFNVEADKDLLDDARLKEITNSEIGDYEIKTNKNGIEKTTIIKITDLTPPTLVLKDVSIYDDEKISGKDSFIVSATDASGEVTTTMKTQLDYNKLGAQQVIIEAVDKYGNKTEQTATFTRHKDTIGPVFSGLSDINVSKGATINYEQGVTARDAKDGVCSFSVDSSSVNTSAAGTYYATYTSSDTKGNKTTKKRKISVKHNQADVDALVRNIASGIGSNVEEIRDYCRNKISYGHSYGDGDPVWYGFNNWTGNCYVHAMCFQALLRAKGYETQLIWVTNQTHYWNLVKLNGVWRHMDSTPDRNHRKISIMTDEQRLSTLSGRDWDHSAWPAAN